MRRRIYEAEYSSWLLRKGVPSAHLSAHNFALRLFEDRGGLSAGAMQELIEIEERKGADSSRLRNLQAAAQYIRLYLEQQEPELELEKESFGLPANPSEQGDPSEQDIPLLDLGFDESGQDPHHYQRPMVDTASGSTPASHGIGTNSQGHGACDCSPESKALTAMPALMLAGPSITLLYIIVRVVFGKSFSAMANWGVVAALAVSALLLLRMKCDRCENILDVGALPPPVKRSLLLLRIVLSAVAILFIVLTIRSYGVWAEERRVENMSDEEFETEYLESYKLEVEAELGYELSDSEFETYLEKEEAADRLEAEEIYGRPLTDDEYEDWF